MSTPILLIIDDEPSELTRLGSLLQTDYKVLVATDGSEGLKRAQGTTHPDLILLDVKMPGMDGYEVCRRLKADEATSEIPVMFLTAAGDPADEARGLALGAVDYITKPIAPAIVRTRIATQVELGILSRRMKNALAERTRALSEANAQLRKLAMEVSLAEEQEKKRLAANLHDSPMQKLALARIRLEMATASGDLVEVKNHLSEGCSLTREIMEELRYLQFELSPPLLYQAGLDAALKWLAFHASTRWKLPFSFSCSRKLPELSQELSIVLYQFARELVFNVVKHAEARHGWIRLDTDDNGLRLRVDDDGMGFGPDVEEPLAAGAYKGFGLVNIRERLNLLGGRMEIESGDFGTHVALTVPDKIHGGLYPRAPYQPAASPDSLVPR